MSKGDVRAKMPPWSRVLFEPQWRYISARGGRGSGKTKNFARALVIMAAQRPIRVLCTREVQDSIKESVYEQFKLEIKELGLDSMFDVLSSEIRSKCGSLFIFKGLNDLTVGNVKSMTDINYCWIEEAQYITEESWEKLVPSIRANGSQIWLSWNPELETDFIYQKVVKEKLPECASLFINFDSNPWFPDVLKIEEQEMAARDPIRHRHVWYGEPLPAVPSAIYFNEIATMERDNRVINMFEDPLLSTYIFMDLGIGDFTSCGVVQRSGGEFRFIDFLENNRESLKWYSDELSNRGYNDAIMVMPHDAYSKSLQTGKSSAEIMESYGWTVEPVGGKAGSIIASVEEGIRMTRELMSRTWMDKTRCESLIEHMKRYQRNKHGHPAHDEHSHACDMVRYAALHESNMSNNQSMWGAPLRYKSLGIR